MKTVLCSLLPLALCLIALATPSGASSSTTAAPGAPMTPTALACRETRPGSPIPWSCFESSVAIVESNQDWFTVCSGVAISPAVVLTAAHCIAGYREGDDIEIHTGASWFKGRPAEALVEIGRWGIARDYNPGRSLFHSDYAVLRLKQPLKIRSFPNLVHGKPILTPGEKLYRIGFGTRGTVNRRTMTTVFVNSVENGTLITNDALGVHGDSGGPVFRFDIDEDGYRRLILIATHSTWDPSTNVSYAPLTAF